jgi:hypothetical protein
MSYKCCRNGYLFRYNEKKQESEKNELTKKKNEKKDEKNDKVPKNE